MSLRKRRKTTEEPDEAENRPQFHFNSITLQNGCQDELECCYLVMEIFHDPMMARVAEAVLRLSSPTFDQLFRSLLRSQRMTPSFPSSSSYISSLSNPMMPSHESPSAQLDSLLSVVQRMLCFGLLVADDPTASSSRQPVPVSKSTRLRTSPLLLLSVLRVPHYEQLFPSESGAAAAAIRMAAERGSVTPQDLSRASEKEKAFFTEQGRPNIPMLERRILNTRMRKFLQTLYSQKNDINRVLHTFLNVLPDEESASVRIAAVKDAFGGGDVKEALECFTKCDPPVLDMVDSECVSLHVEGVLKLMAMFCIKEFIRKSVMNGSDGMLGCRIFCHLLDKRVNERDLAKTILADESDVKAALDRLLLLDLLQIQEVGMAGDRRQFVYTASTKKASRALCLLLFQMLKNCLIRCKDVVMHDETAAKLMMQADALLDEIFILQWYLAGGNKC